MDDPEAIQHLDRVHGVVARTTRAATVRCFMRDRVPGEQWPMDFSLALEGEANQPGGWASTWTVLSEREHSELLTGERHIALVRRWEVVHQGPVTDVACELASWMLARGVMLGPEALEVCEARGVGYEIHADGRITLSSRELIVEAPESPFGDNIWLRRLRRPDVAVRCSLRGAGV